MTGPDQDAAADAEAARLAASARTALAVLGWTPGRPSPGESPQVEMTRYLGMLRFLVNQFASRLGPHGELLVAEWADWAAATWAEGPPP